MVCSYSILLGNFRDQAYGSLVCIYDMHLAVSPLNLHYIVNICRSLSALDIILVELEKSDRFTMYYGLGFSVGYRLLV